MFIQRRQVGESKHSPGRLVSSSVHLGSPSVRQTRPLPVQGCLMSGNQAWDRPTEMKSEILNSSFSDHWITRKLTANNIKKIAFFLTFFLVGYHGILHVTSGLLSFLCNVAIGILGANSHTCQEWNHVNGYSAMEAFTALEATEYGNHMAVCFTLTRKCKPLFVSICSCPFSNYNLSIVCSSAMQGCAFDILTTGEVAISSSSLATPVSDSCTLSSFSQSQQTVQTWTIRLITI